MNLEKIGSSCLIKIFEYFGIFSTNSERPSQHCLQPSNFIQIFHDISHVKIIFHV